MERKNMTATACDGTGAFALKCEGYRSEAVYSKVTILVLLLYVVRGKAIE